MFQLKVLLNVGCPPKVILVQRNDHLFPVFVVSVDKLVGKHKAFELSTSISTSGDMSTLSPIQCPSMTSSDGIRGAGSNGPDVLGKIELELWKSGRPDLFGRLLLMSGMEEPLPSPPGQTLAAIQLMRKIAIYCPQGRGTLCQQ